MTPVQEETIFQDERTGIVHIPTLKRTGPGHPEGMFAMAWAHDLDGGRALKFHTHHTDEVWVEYTLATSVLPVSSLFQLSMRFKTDADQPLPLTVTMKRGDRTQSVVVHQMDISLPNTHNQWQTLEAVPIPIELGGAPNTMFEVRHVKPAGTTGIWIRDFQLIPAANNNHNKSAVNGGEYSTEWFYQWKESLKTKLMNEWLSPNLLQQDPAARQAFQEACHVVSLAQARQAECNKNKEDEAVKQEAAKDLEKAMEDCLEAAKPWLENTIDPCLRSIDFGGADIGKELLQCLVLVHATPPLLATYCSKGTEQQQRLMDFLEHAKGMQEMFVHGGPSGGNYGRALDILAQIEAYRNNNKQDNHQSVVLPKLAMAVALELAEPIAQFDQPAVFVDPLERYQHYEQAYFNRELDPTFEHLTVWELRMVVNSDAPNEQLAWCRSMIRNYHPDICLMDDYRWRYGWIVRSDVYYKQPEWPREPKDYMQLVSGGGQCGPRAWMGRFACKAFGMPTWGCQQPGHAALGRWTPDGWTTILGVGFERSFWNGRQGLDFVCETKIRASNGDFAYFQSTELLAWIGKMTGEKEYISVPCPTHLWSSLALMQRIRLSNEVQPQQQQQQATDSMEQCEIFSQITEMRQLEPENESIAKADDGSIVVPVSCVASKSGNATFMKSFLGGKQVVLKPDWQLSYNLPEDMMMAQEKETYKMTVRIVTIHENDPPPLLVSVENKNDKSVVREYSISIPYTMGAWQDTEPVEIELGAAETVMLSRKEQKYPFTIKDFKLIPCGVAK